MKNIIRPDLLAMKPYSSARSEFKGNARIYLDANENPYGTSFRGLTGLNRYPDPLQTELKERISGSTGLDMDRIIAGNGSDEILDLLVRATTIPGKSNIITIPPTYGMYNVVAAINNVLVKEVLPDEDFNFTADDIIEALDIDTRIVFICSPNNPTGKLAPEREVMRLAEKFNGLVVIDEAYIDFSGTDGFLSLIEKFENIFILRTFSKAWAMAGARLGLGFGHPGLVKVLNTIKMPYNVNT
ncbi:MAG: aminotransferase class I/II-fold pyridoxal phosphate-dependent enzyme, partial [Bacteroidales bacterium]|nr:aminotransferase class I/II-fold pyridoxal phosphate-dependent enzyme [Bacteroidales bacterium]